MKEKQYIISFLLFSFFSTITQAQGIIPPQPVGGEILVKQFIDQEMIYPPDAMKRQVEGTVVLDLVVNEFGSVSQVVARTKVDPLLDAEALRILKFLVWQPAQYMGKAIGSKASLEISFSLKHYRKACRERGYLNIEFPDIPMDTSGVIYQYKYTEQHPFPVFESKKMNLQNFLAENFVYPEEALRKSISGVVKLNFIVEPHGHISNIMVKEFLGAGCTEEAIRLVKLLRWNPGINDGKAVRVNLTLPIKFGLTEEGKCIVSPAEGGTTFQ